MQRYAICNDWEFTDEFTPAFARGEGEGLSVRIPHTCKQLPLSYFNEKSSEMVCGYRRRIDIPKNWVGRSIFVTFDGIASCAVVYINGVRLPKQSHGYTSFSVELTRHIRFGKDNLLCVELDVRQSIASAQFGDFLDALMCCGLYRDVWLETGGNQIGAELFDMAFDIDDKKKERKKNIYELDCLCNRHVLLLKLCSVQEHELTHAVCASYFKKHTAIPKDNGIFTPMHDTDQYNFA